MSGSRAVWIAALLAGTALSTPAGAADSTWTGSSPNSSNWDDVDNWSNGVPGGTDVATFASGLGAYAVVPTQIGSIEVGAGGGSVEVHDTFDIDNGIAGGDDLFFMLLYATTRFNGGTITGNVSIDVQSQGGAYPDLLFYGSASAGSATLTNDTGGEIGFYDAARGGAAQIFVNSGSVGFHDQSDAEGATIVTNGTGATASFSGSSSAGHATITNSNGFVIFADSASAGSATISNDAASSLARKIEFNDSSSAGTATIRAQNSGNLEFFDTSTAGSATLIASGARITFQDNSTAADATLIAKSMGAISFRLDSSGGNARFVTESGGTISINLVNGAGTTAGSIEGAGKINLGGKTLTVGSNDLSTEFSGVIAGTNGNLTKVGTGKLTLSGTNLYTGLTTVSGGTLSVNGSILSSSGVVVNGGSLGGTGSIPSVTLAAGGTLAPGNSIGTLNVTGNLSFAPGSTYAVEVDAAGNSDKTLVSGTTTISGGSVSVLAQPGSYADHTSYTILTAGSVVGTFDDVSSNLAFLVPTLSYDGQNVILALDRNAVGFASVGDTVNERAAGGAVETLGSGNAVYDAVLGLSAPEANAAFDAVSGEIYASLQNVLAETSLAERGAMIDRLEGHGTGIWGRLTGAYGGIAGDGNAAAVASGSGGIMLGIDGMAGDWRLGVLLHGGTSAVRSADRGSSATSTDLGAGAYGGTAWGGTHLEFGADYAHHDIAARRDVSFPGFSETLSAGYGAATMQGFVELSQKLDLGGATLSPYANLAHVRVSTDRFTETGGNAALSNAGEMFEATFATLGVRAGQSFAFDDGRTVAIEGAAGWRHGFEKLADASNAFAEGAAFTVYGAPIGGDALVLHGGLAVGLTEATQLTLGYDGQLGVAQSHTLKATLSGAF